MSKTLRLTESEMISLVERIIKEQYDSKKLYSREYIVNRLKQEKSAKLRNAKIRLSNIKLEEITQVLRGQSKWIKH